MNRSALASATSGMRFSNSGRVRAISASALRSTAYGPLAFANCQSQGSARGEYPQPTTRGPMSSVSNFGSWRSTPGIADGTQDPELSAPALPKEQLLPDATVRAPLP